MTDFGPVSSSQPTSRRDFMRLVPPAAVFSAGAASSIIAPARLLDRLMTHRQLMDWHIAELRRLCEGQYPGIYEWRVIIEESIVPLVIVAKARAASEHVRAST